MSTLSTQCSLCRVDDETPRTTTLHCVANMPVLELHGNAHAIRRWEKVNGSRLSPSKTVNGSRLCLSKMVNGSRSCLSKMVNGSRLCLSKMVNGSRLCPPKTVNGSRLCPAKGGIESKWETWEKPVLMIERSNFQLFCTLRPILPSFRFINWNILKDLIWSSKFLFTKP